MGQIITISDFGTLLASRPLLAHISLAAFLWDICKQCKQDQAPQDAASDQGLHCLLTECSIKI